MPALTRRRRLGATSALAALAMFATPVAAIAQAQVHQFDIPAQDLASALRAFARASGQQVVFDAGLTRGKRSQGVRATLSAEAALDQLLAGTGLSAARANGGIFMIRETAMPSQGSPASTDMRQVAAEAPAERAAEPQITVTGTRIRGVRNVAAPTMEITREEIEQTGFATVEEVFDALPQNLSEVSHDGTFATGTSRLAGTNTQSAVGISLRGLGPESTLVLLNGTRRPGNVFGRVTDISAIPLAIIDRVEIVSGGRSAVYGSDAVAGVVNLVTRRSFEGAESQASFGWARHGAERLQLSQVVGFHSDDAGLVAAYDFLRSWSLDHQDTGLRQPSPFGLVPGRFDLQPDSRRHSVFLAGNFDAAPGVQLRADALYTNDRNESTASYGIPGIFELSQTTIVASEQYSAALGARFALWRGWALDISGTHGEVRNDERYISGGQTGGGRVVAGLSQLAAVADGPLFSTGMEDARIAIGAEYRRESLKQTSRATGLVTNDLDRDVGSAFAELFVPFVLDEAGDHRIELSLAGRYDDYSGFGGTFNPQGGLVWQPARGLRLRGAYSRAFRAPR
jgi:iron complex outermembrane recepter protein